MPFIMKLANTSSRSVLLRSALDAECPAPNATSAQDSDSSKPSNERYRCRLQQASNMPVEVFPGASQPSRRNPSEVQSATDSSNSARNVRQSVSGLCKPKRSACVNYSKSSGAQLGYDNKDHMQLAYTYTSYTCTEQIHAPETSHLPDDFSLWLVYSPSYIRSAAAVVLICAFNTTSTSFQPSSELLTELRPCRPRPERLR